MPGRLLNTNILLSYFTRDDEENAQRALALFTRVERGEESIETSVLVVFETIFTLQRVYRVPRGRIRDLMAPILKLRGLHLPGKGLCLDALDFYADKNVSFADAFNRAYMLSHGISEIYSWDTDFDSKEGVKRIEPEA
jgi:predicted nucleic acid-binding protein